MSGNKSRCGPQPTAIDIARHKTWYSMTRCDFSKNSMFFFSRAHMRDLALITLIVGSAFGGLHAVEQQLVVHWKSSTSADVYRFIEGSQWGQNSRVEPDQTTMATYITLGYFTGATASGVDSDLFFGSLGTTHLRHKNRRFQQRLRL